jgi:hypothetical protein
MVESKHQPGQTWLWKGFYFPCILLWIQGVGQYILFG